MRQNGAGIFGSLRSGGAVARFAAFLAQNQRRQCHDIMRNHVKGGLYSMFYLDFLLRAVDTADTVTRSFVTILVPELMKSYSDTSAKGGDHSQNSEYDERTQRIFQEKDDQ